MEMIHQQAQTADTYFNNNDCKWSYRTFEAFIAIKTTINNFNDSKQFHTLFRNDKLSHFPVELNNPTQ